VIGIAHAIVPTNSPHILLESLDLMCEELEHICIQNRVSAKTLTLEVKNEKFRQRQKQYTHASTSMSDKKAFKSLATTLLH